MSINDDLWKWLKNAPLPVVLAIALTGFAVLGSWVWVVADEAAQARTAAAVAAEQAKTAKENSEKAEKADEQLDVKIEKANEKLDRLLAIVLHVQAELDADKKAKK